VDQNEETLIEALIEALIGVLMRVTTLALVARYIPVVAMG
jgi:hypothetical protein